MPKVLTRETKEEKVNFQAKYIYDKHLIERGKLGYHFYDKHINPMEVAPQRRADGFTMCNFCDMQHLDWEKLKEETRQSFVKQVELFHESDKAWNEYSNH